MNTFFLKTYAKGSKNYIGNFPIILNGPIDCVKETSQNNILSFPTEDCNCEDMGYYSTTENLSCYSVINYNCSDGKFLTCYKPCFPNPSFCNCEAFGYNSNYTSLSCYDTLNIPCDNGDILVCYRECQSLRPFDYAVLRYIWDSNGGTDLDTRTAFIDLSPSYNGIYVGWCRETTIPSSTALNDCQVSTITGDLSGYYIAHGGDNCNVGVEAILLNLKKTSQDFPALSSISLNTRAWWYGSKNNGNLTVQFETYLGGIMSRSNYDFINIGGTLVDSLTIAKNSSTYDPNCSNDGDNLGKLIYYPATKKGKFV